MKIISQNDNLEVLNLSQYCVFEQHFKCKAYHLDFIRIGIYAYVSGTYGFSIRIVDIENSLSIYSNTVSFNIDSVNLNYVTFPINARIMKNKEYCLQICNLENETIGIVTGDKCNDMACIFNNVKILKNADIQFKSEQTQPISNFNIVVYTCIIDGYDKLKEIENPNDCIDYICYSDKYVSSDTWQVRDIPKSLDYLENAKKARCLKIMPHLFLPDYDVSIWTDGNIHAIGDMIEFIDRHMKTNFNIAKHPNRTCIYQEAEAIIRLGKDSFENLQKQVEKYMNEKYPENYGMVQSGILLRRHNEEDCIELSKAWWKEVFDGSKRDQLSFNYACWKNNMAKIGIFNPNIISSKYFEYCKHGENSYVIRLPEDYGSLENYMNGTAV